MSLRFLLILSMTALASSMLTAQVTLTKRDVKCSGDKNGKVTVASINNATYPIRNYEWSNGVSGPSKKTIENLSGGLYTVTVTDFNQCTAMASINVLEPESSLSLEISSSANEFFLCGTSSITVVAQPSGGSPPYNTNGQSGAFSTHVSLASFGGGPKYLDFQTTDGHGCTKKQRQFFAFSAIACPETPMISMALSALGHCVGSRPKIEWNIPSGLKMTLPLPQLRRRW